MSQQRTIGYLLTAILFLISGAVLYYFTRPDMVLFQWLPFPTGNRIPANKLLTGFAGDLAWCISICLVIVALSKAKKLSNLSALLLVMLPFVTEFSQMYEIVPGVFDVFDLLLYGVVLMIFKILFPKYFFIWKRSGNTFPD